MEKKQLTEPVCKIIARIHTDFPEKFGVPRQSGLIDTLYGTVTFEPAYRDPAAVRGLEEFSHIWLLWQFSQCLREGWSPTVRPPRLGGNTRMGVFATRSPYRPNAIGLSCVRLLKVVPETPDGPLLYVAGADLVDGTPIYDIKPYLPFTDSHPEAEGGFAELVKDHALQVFCSDDLLATVPESRRAPLLAVLAHDPRPAYHHDPERIYGLDFAGMAVRFQVKERKLTVISLEQAAED